MVLDLQIPLNFPKKRSQSAGKRSLRGTLPASAEYADAVWWEGEYFEEVDIFEDDKSVRSDRVAPMDVIVKPGEEPV